MSGGASQKKVKNNFCFSMTMFHAQHGQDRWLQSHIFKSFRGGVFVDVGAHDGVTYNNTLFFEDVLGWKGVNIEPLPRAFAELKRMRPTCTNLNVAISSENYGSAEFYQCFQVAEESQLVEMLSGLKQYFPTEQRAKIDEQIRKRETHVLTVRVPTRTLASVFNEYKISRVEYLSVDVEGAEEAVLQSIDFDKVFIDCIQFECNYQRLLPPILRLLEGKGFVQVHHGDLDVFMVHTASKFFTQDVETLARAFVPQREVDSVLTDAPTKSATMSRPKRTTADGAPAADIDERIKRQRDELWTKFLQNAIRGAIFDTLGGGPPFAARMQDVDPAVVTQAMETSSVTALPAEAKATVAPAPPVTGPTQYEEKQKCKQCHAGAVSKSGFDLGVCSDCWAYSFTSGKIKTTGFEDMLKAMLCVVCRNAPIYRHNSETAAFTCQDCFKGRTPQVKAMEKEKEMFAGSRVK